MKKYDIIIIGGGPAGYEAAASAVKQGLQTLIVESDLMGGTCLNRGCIPTKSFCRSAEVMDDVRDAADYGISVESPAVSVDMTAVVERKNRIVSTLREGVEMMVKGADILYGEARFIPAGEVSEISELSELSELSTAVVAVGEESFTAPKILIATGSVSRSLPIPGRELCITSDTLLDITALPSSLAIIGGGVIGMEFASIFNSFGCQVTVIEYCKEILPGFDRDIAKRLRSVLSRKGITFILNAAAEEVKETPEGLFTFSYTAKNKPGEVTASQVLMAVGRKPRIPAGFEEAGGNVERGAIAVDDHFMTTIEGVYAVGDCNGKCMLAHAASAQARYVMGEDTDLSPIPAAVFTVPEVASVGLTEEAAKEAGLPYRTVKIPVRSNGKALTLGSEEGLVKFIIAVPETDTTPAAETPYQSSTEDSISTSEANIPSAERLLGLHILGPHASDLIMEGSLAISAGLPLSSLTRAIHPHPTLSELLSHLP